MKNLEMRPEVNVKVTQNGMHHSAIPRGITTQNLGFLHHIYRRYALVTIILKTRSEVKVTVTQKWFMTLRYPKMHLHTKFGIHISKNIGDMHQFLETRLEVKFKVTVTSLWYTTRRHPKMHPHTKFEIPTSNNIRDMLWT